MIISTITQLGLRLRADPEKIPFQYSANVQMKFEKDENYDDYTVIGYYIPPGENEAKLLNINDDGTFTLGPDCFKNRGTLSFSFNLVNSIEEVHLGSIDFEVRYAFGDGDTILPEPEEVWISLVTQVAKDAIKEDVALVKQKASEALQSATLANEKASEAEEYANNANQSADSASLSASSALTAKNDAIAASNSAIQAKQDAEQSANNAKNSANTALENANKSTEAIETVTQIKTEIENKANDFDTNYQEKLKSFNDNATSKQNAFDNSVQTANTNLDNKVNQANSDLDAKVQEATEQAQKATDEANRAEQATDGKLDKNLGSENSDKVLITDAEGNVITQNKEDFEGGGTTNYNDLENKPQINGVELKGNKTSGDLKMYTQEEVDYLLNDKMDKPYVPITITDNATITDALEGNFKIDKIKGNTYQKVETDIVPTPDRPVPINSRKVKANGSYVELRSLKETENLFDYNLATLLDYEYLELNEAGDGLKIKRFEDRLVSDLPYSIPIKANTYLNFYCEGAVPSIGVFFLGYEEESWYQLGTISSNKQTVSVGNSFDGEMKFMFNNAVGDELSKLTVTLYTGSGENKFIPQTIRDYKIVDHTNKTAKIVRNVGLYVNDKTGDKWSIYDNSSYPNSYLIQLKDMKTSYRVLSFCNSFNPVNDNTGVNNPNSMWIGVNGTIVFIIKTNFKTLDEWKEWLTDNDLSFLYPLATPVEEQILYREDDVSEIGYSWQDTTSPSPDIPSEVCGVDKIDITVTGKNLFDFSKVKEADQMTVDYENETITIPANVNNAGYINSLKDLMGGHKIGETYTMSAKTSNIEAQRIIYFLDIKSSIKFDEPFTLTEEMLNSPFAWYNNIESENQNIISSIQIERGTTATPYTPYVSQQFEYTPTNPMHSTQDGSIADHVDVENGVEVYNMKNSVLNQNNEWMAVESTQYNDYYLFRCHVARLNILPQITPQIIQCEELQISSSGNAPEEKQCFYLNVFENALRYFYIVISKTLLNDGTVDSLKSYLTDNPLHITYATTTPTEIPILQDDLSKLKSLKTNAGVNNIFINGEVKPIVEARYPQDVVSAVNKLQTKLLTLQEEVVKNV